MRRLSPLLLCLPLLFAGKCKDKAVGDVEDADIDLNPPEVELQLTSIDPDQVEPGTSFRATLYGDGIEEGAEVWVGDTEIASVLTPSTKFATISVPPLQAGMYDVKLRNPGGETATLRNALVAETRVAATTDCDDIQVRFAFDSYSLDGPAQATLREKSQCFTLRTGAIRVEGHCDERGTTEYNLALGNRRADAIERFLVAQGVPPSRIRTVSYGEERPLDSGHSESAWAQNRRGEIVVAP